MSSRSCEPICPRLVFLFCDSSSKFHATGLSVPRLLGAQSLLLQSDGPSRDDHLLLSLAGVRLVVVVVHVGIVSESAWFLKKKTWRVFFCET